MLLAEALVLPLSSVLLYYKGRRIILPRDTLRGDLHWLPFRKEYTSGWRGGARFALLPKRGVTVSPKYMASEARNML